MTTVTVDKLDASTTRIICPPGSNGSGELDAALASINATSFTFDYHIREDGTEVFTVEANRE